MKNSLNKGASLVEITIALFILAIAILPLVGNITNDTKNAVVLANSEFAMQKARYILDTMLDSVDFDDLEAGDPALLKGVSNSSYHSAMFPEGDGKFCKGYFYDGKGQRFFATMRAVDIPNDIIAFSSFKNPDIMDRFSSYKGGNKTEAEQAEITEANSPSYASYSVYADKDWGKTVETFKYEDFFQDEKIGNLMKVLILQVKWNDKDKLNPESPGGKEFYLVTHKARLKK